MESVEWPEATESSGLSEARSQEGVGLPRQPGKSRFES
jgi:hypothetical protein